MINSLRKLCILPLALSIAGCGVSQIDDAPPNFEPYQHSTNVLWVAPPNNIISLAGAYATYIVENPDRVDRFLGVVPFESAPNHWDKDIHYGSHDMASVTWIKEDAKGMRLREEVISFDERGRVKNIDKIGKLSGPVQYMYVGSMTTPIKRTVYTNKGSPSITYYYRDQYGNFMGFSSNKGSGQVNQNLVDYRNIGSKFVVTLRADLPEREDFKNNKIGSGEAIWRYDLKSADPSSYPEYVKTYERLKKSTVISERITETRIDPLNAASAGGFEGRVTHSTLKNDGANIKELHRYANGEVVAKNKEKDTSVETRIYSHYKYDKKGNWVSRTVTKHITNSPPQTIKETRKIKYR